MSSPRLSFSTVQVEPGRVHLGMTYRFKNFEFPYDRADDLARILERERRHLTTISDRYPDQQSLLFQLRDNYKYLCHYRDHSALSRIMGACDLIHSEIDSGAYSKAIVFAKRFDIIQMARLYLKDYYPVSRFIGSNPNKIEKNQKRFDDPDSLTKIFLCDINAAAKLNLDLSAASHVFFFEESMEMRENAMSIERVRRNSTSNEIFIRNFCLTDPLDQRVQEAFRDQMRLRCSEVQTYQAPTSILDLL